MMNIQIFGTKKCNDTFRRAEGREASGESAGDKDTDCQERKAGDGGVCTGGLEGLELISVRRKYESYQRLMESRFLK